MNIIFTALSIILCIVLLPFVLLLWLFTMICTLFIKRKEYYKHSRFFRWLLNVNTAVCKAIFNCKFVVTGKEILPKDGRFVLVSNHRSNFDPIWTWLVLRKSDVAFLTKEKNRHIFAFGKIICKCCFLPIDRENARNALVTVKKSAQLITDNQASIGVYPEGTRNFSAKGLLPFHDCVFKVAQLANVPIVIMTVDGTEKIHVNFPFRRTTIKFDFLEVIPTEEVCTMRTCDIGEHVRKVMLDNLQPQSETATIADGQTEQLQ